MNPRLWLPAVAIAVALAGCGGNAPQTGGTNARIEQCVARILRNAPGPVTDEGKRYVRTTYCGPFDGRGWVYEDGSLGINAYLHLEKGASCATAKEGEPARTVPCEELEREGPLVLDCAILRVVRRSEVQEHLASLQRDREVKCDDGTPLAELGAS